MWNPPFAKKREGWAPTHGEFEENAGERGRTRRQRKDKSANAPSDPVFPDLVSKIKRGKCGYPPVFIIYFG